MCLFDSTRVPLRQPGFEEWRSRDRERSLSIDSTFCVLLFSRVICWGRSRSQRRGAGWEAEKLWRGGLLGGGGGWTALGYLMEVIWNQWIKTEVWDCHGSQRGAKNPERREHREGRLTFVVHPLSHFWILHMCRVRKWKADKKAAEFLQSQGI